MITVDEIKTLRSDRQTYYSELHNQQKIDDDYYELLFDAGVPEKAGYEQRTPPHAREWVDVGVRHYTLDNPKAKVYSRGDSDTARGRDIILESFYDFWLRKIILQIKEAAKKLLLRGEIFLKVWIDDTYMGIDTSNMTDEEKEYIRQRKRLHFPLTLEVVEPINTLASPAHEGLVPLDVIEDYKMTVSDAKALCARNNWTWNAAWDKNKKADRKSTDKVKWTSYISGAERCFMIEDTPLLTPEVQPNILKFCPYVHIGAGFGNSNYEGKPEYLYRSILYGKRDMFKMDSRMLSQLDSIGQRYGYPWTKIIGEPEAVERVYPGGKMPTNPKGDRVIRETTDVKVEILEAQSPPPGIFEQLAIVAAEAQPPAVLAGTRPRGVYSAQGIEDLISTSKPIYKDAFKNLEDGLAVLMGMGARTIEQVYKDEVAIVEAMEGE